MTQVYRPNSGPDQVVICKGQLDIIIKLGGSAITEKGKLETLKKEDIEIASAMLKKCLDDNLSCVVVHGAGSFGHHQAHQYGVSKGMPSHGVRRKEVQQGFALTRLSVLKLNHHICSSLVSAGLPAVPVSPCGHWETCDRQVVVKQVDAIGKLLAAGFLPITHGDCVLDQQQGCTILSGDTIIQELCAELQPTRVVFLSDVLGFYSLPPDQTGAELLEHISVRPDGSIDADMHTSKLEQDTTGGIKHKLDASTQIVQQSDGHITVFLTSIRGPGAERACRMGHLKENEGTTITYRS